METFEHLSDDELRVKLLQYGFANLPITQTTRKTLIKKLRNHIAGANETLRKSTSLVTRYSSGEDSDTLDNSASASEKWKKKSRITVSGSPGVQMPPPKSYNTQPLLPSANTRASRATPPTTSLPRATYSPSTSSSKRSSVYVSPVIINDSEGEDNSWRGMNSQPTYSRNYSNNYSQSPDTSYKNGSNGHNEPADDHNSTTETTKRLLQFRQHLPTAAASNNNHISSGNSFRKRTTYGASPRDIVYQADPSHDGASHKNGRLDFKQKFVPMALLTLVGVFFALVIFCYFQISPNIQTFMTPTTTVYSACDGDQSSSSSPGTAQTCIEESSLDSALNLLKNIAPELQSRSIGFRCGDKTVPSPLVCVREFGRLVTDAQRFANIHEDTRNIEYLVDRNRQWGISNVDAKGRALTLEEVTELQPAQHECFGILEPKLPLTCRIRNKIHTYFTIIGSLAVTGIVGFAAWKFYQWILFVKRRRTEQMDHIIRKICGELKERAGHEGSSVVVNHLRDKIIDPAKRSELTAAWNEAIAYLEHNESRIHFGVECVNGEDFKVMQWIDEVKSTDQSTKRATASPKKYQEQQQQLPPHQHYATTKKWMGSAFDSSNKIKDPPTNCLKIRNMFNKFETTNSNLKQLIQDTLLFKLKERSCKLYDIQLDTKSCCVYVKCATCSDAGIVHEETNGWWLETEIVVVKFLKLDKYHQRFPESMQASSPLQPSSNVFVMKSDNGTNGHDDFYDDGDDEYD